VTTVRASFASPQVLAAQSVRRPWEVFSLPNLPSAVGGGNVQVELASMHSLLRLQEGFANRPVVPPLGAPSGSAVTATAASVSAPTGPVRRPAMDGLSGLSGRSVGSGQCVALVQAAAPEIGSTRGWSHGALVRGNLSLQPGTPIATFDASGRYANARDGSSHAAIYLGQDATGIQVLDQWVGKASAVRTIPWVSPGATAANSGERFNVVAFETARSSA
jgi:hypothetical protein